MRTLVNTNATAAARAAVRTARRDFTDRGRHLTAIAAALAQGAGTWPLRGPVFSAAWAGTRFRSTGYLLTVTARHLTLLDCEESDQEYQFALGQLPTGDLARLAQLLAAQLPAA